ncbi:MAG TPA: flavin reductase family protein [Pyrinomonadaceae bacterium]|nr:flavin reductase family protein [Pyrinomonadaceae bacterium]
MTRERTLTSPYITNSIIEGAVGLILVEAGSRRNAMTISCFSEAAHHPATLWISVAKTAYSYELILETGRFTLAMLNRNQSDIALRCGTMSGRDHDKCAALDLYQNPEGFLFLHRALASTACTIRQTIDIDDHTLFVADILSSDLDSRSAHLRHLLLSDLRGPAQSV